LTQGCAAWTKLLAGHDLPSRTVGSATFRHIPVVTAGREEPPPAAAFFSIGVGSMFIDDQMTIR
jgi:hypothetical protein